MLVTTREPRAANRMDPETKRVHLLLEEWAGWAKDPGITGYPRQSLTEKAAKYGKLGIPQESLHKPEPLMPTHLLVIDAAIARLGMVDGKALKLYYMEWAPPEILARRMDRSMRARQFLNVVRRARWRVMGFMDAASLNAISNADIRAA